MSHEVFGVLESTDMIYVNFFTDVQAAEEWVASERLGNEVIGPFNFETTETLPFSIVLGCDAEGYIEQVYLEDEVEDEALSSHGNIHGAYQVYEDIEHFESSVQ